MGRKKFLYNYLRFFTNTALTHPCIVHWTICQLLSYLWNAQICSYPSPLRPPGAPHCLYYQDQISFKVLHSLFLSHLSNFLSALGLWAAPGNFYRSWTKPWPLHPLFALPFIWLTNPTYPEDPACPNPQVEAGTPSFHLVTPLVVKYYTLVISFPCLSYPLDYELLENWNYDLFFCTSSTFNILSDRQ